MGGTTLTTSIRTDLGNTLIRRKEHRLREGLLLLTGLIIGAYLHYNAPLFVTLVLQVVVLLAFYKSRLNYPWVFIVYFVSFNPGGLFSLTEGEALLLFSSPEIGSLSFQMVFIIVGWLKTITQKPPVFFSPRFFVIVAYMLLQVPIFGLADPIRFLRMLIIFSWLILLPRLLRNQKEFEGLFYMILLGNLFVFVTNLFQIITGAPMVSLFTLRQALGSGYDPDLLVRTAYGIQIAHLAVFGGLSYLTREKPTISPVFAYSGIVLGFLNIVFSATRGWVFGSLFLILVYGFFLIPRLFRNIMIVVPVLIVSGFAIWQVPIIRNQILKSYDRVLYFENILNPDLDVETSDIGRVTRSEPVLRSFRESPVLGHGFGGRARTDGHVGNQSMLAQLGIIGYLLFVNLWLGFIVKMYRSGRSSAFHEPELFRLKMLCAITFVSVFIIHSTSAGFLHPSSVLYGVIWYSLIFAFGNHLVNTRLAVSE